jgi:hypothetical protein
MSDRRLARFVRRLQIGHPKGTMARPWVATISSIQSQALEMVPIELSRLGRAHLVDAANLRWRIF